MFEEGSGLLNTISRLHCFSVIKTLCRWSRTFPDFWKAINSQGLPRYSTLTSLKGELEETSWSTRDEPRPWRKTYHLIFKIAFICLLLNVRQNQVRLSLVFLYCFCLSSNTPNLKVK
jgi:hypothetical protein